MKFKPTIAIVLDTRTIHKDGTYPVRIRATFQAIRDTKKIWVRKYYDTGYNFTRGVYEAVMGKTRVEEYKRIAMELKSIENRALQICKDHAVVTPEIFSRLFTGASGHTVGSQFDRYIAELKEFDQVGTAANYKAAINSLKAYAKGDFTFMEVTEDFLRRYQKAMIAKGTSVNTVAIYLRNLRKIFNDAIATKIISADYYPFGRRAFQIQTQKRHKHALSVEQKNRVLERLGDWSVDFWAFSYFCNGMNITDICHLRRGDIQDGFIVFRRAKTKRTSKELSDIYVPIRGEVEAIIARRGDKNLDPSAYLFPVLSEGLTPQQAKYKILDFMDKVNTGLREVAKDLKFTFKFTTYTARHTFATISINSGARMEFIQEALGHSDLKTHRRTSQASTRKPSGRRVRGFRALVLYFRR